MLNADFLHHKDCCHNQALSNEYHYHTHKKETESIMNQTELTESLKASQLAVFPVHQPFLVLDVTSFNNKEITTPMYTRL